jgi:pyrimidine-nucleoside phosphorylase/thymidine phosphorylase
MPTSDELLYAMRSGSEQPADAIEAFVRGVVDGSLSRPQAAAWLAWAYSRGLTDAETVALTRAMTRSGTTLSWGDGPEVVDKHSTGGVGDKVSLVLAPLWAELGYRVPMISGRGLGHTGGTLDKLEAIPGFRTDLDQDRLQAVLAQVGCFVSGQTASLAPADRVLYALRNETCTVESIPLIVGSILSKKLAAGVSRLVLDVKCGSGAFMVAEDDARALAGALVRVARGAGTDASAWITAMDQPLGGAVGNALEVEESIATLEGGGPADLRELVLVLAQDPRAEQVLASGAAAERFRRMVAAQGGDPDARLHGSGTTVVEVKADRSGVVRRMDARGVGRAAFVLGAGRRRAEDPVDPGVGAIVDRKVGDEVRPGDVLLRLHHRDGRDLEAALALVRDAVEIGEPVVVPPLVRGRIPG